MNYIKKGGHGALNTKLLGIYEKELNQYINQVIKNSAKTIINIGAAEGYYAVGLELKITEAKIIAFEAKSHMRDLLKRIAE